MDKPTRSLTLALAVALATAFAFYMVGFTAWAQPSEPEALATFLTTVILVSLCVAVDRPRSVRRGSEMRLSFLGELTALLCFGPVAMILVAAIASVARVISSRHAVSRPYPQRLRIAALDPVATIGAASMAGWAHLVLGGTTIPLAWPRQAM